MTGYVLSDDADADLQDIFSYGFVTWGEKQATKYIYGLYELMASIGQNPNIGRLRADLHPLVRMFPSRPHAVFFMPWRGSTLIVRVLHGAANHRQAFEGYDPLAALKSD